MSFSWLMVYGFSKLNFCIIMLLEASFVIFQKKANNSHSDLVPF